MNKLINEEFRKIILDTVDKILPSERKPKYSNSYYLDNFIYMLTDLVSYKSLRLIHPNAPKFHYKTICDKHT